MPRNWSNTEAKSHTGERNEIKTLVHKALVLRQGAQEEKIIG